MFLPCIITDSRYRVKASIAVTPLESNTWVKGLFWVERSDGLRENIPLEEGICNAEVEVIDPSTGEVLNTWYYDSPNAMGKYVVEEYYNFTKNYDYLVRFRVYFARGFPHTKAHPHYRVQYPYCEYPYPSYPYTYDYESIVSSIEGDIVFHFRKPKGRYVKLFDEEFGIIIE